MPRSMTALLFQSTRPRGARLRSHCRIRPRADSFNPRAHEGRDERGLRVAGLVVLVSIHAPTRGATRPRPPRPAPPGSFNPRAHEGRDVPVGRTWLRLEVFQSTRPRGARRLAPIPLLGAVKFQSTRPRGARPAITSLSAGTQPFQSTRPRGARPLTNVGVANVTVFQSARPRGARREPRKARRGQQRVSIHAPTRGATAVDAPAGDRREVSIHAPTRGATGGLRHDHGNGLVSIHAPTRGATRRVAVHSGRPAVSIHAPTRGATFGPYVEHWGKMFQSTRPRGARPAPAGQVLHMGLVSIHAPTRGATCPPTPRSPTSTSFNPRAHEGRDTPPRRRPRARCSFNPRAHEGRDAAAQAAGVGLRVSIHAPTRGATWRSSYAGTPATCFNPRAHEGRDLGKAQGGGTADRFQSTRPRGARRGRDGACQHGGRVSIHAPTRGATRGRGAGTRTRGCFNPRAHEGRDSPPSPVSSARCPVSIHAPTRGATWTVLDPKAFTALFQSTRPRGARPAAPPWRPSHTCFNPRAHEGRDT